MVLRSKRAVSSNQLALSNLNVAAPWLGRSIARAGPWKPAEIKSQSEAEPINPCKKMTGILLSCNGLSQVKGKDNGGGKGDGTVACFMLTTDGHL